MAAAKKSVAKPQSAMVETSAADAAKAPPVTQPLTHGAITTTGSGDDSQTAGEHAAIESAEGAAALGAAVLHDDDGKPIKNDDFDGKVGVSRDERHDSVDPHTGTLTDEALELRRQGAGGAE